MAEKRQITPTEKFVLAGNSRFTLVSTKTSARFTYRVRVCENPRNGEERYFVSVLTGADNENDYSFVGCLVKWPGANGFVYQHGHQARISDDAASVIAFEWFFKRLQQGKDLNAVEFWHEGRCAACGRALTVPESIESGFGPICAEKAGL